MVSILHVYLISFAGISKILRASEVASATRVRHSFELSVIHVNQGFKDFRRVLCIGAVSGANKPQVSCYTSFSDWLIYLIYQKR